jgi:hypothetical protein
MYVCMYKYVCIHLHIYIQINIYILIGDNRKIEKNTGPVDERFVGRNFSRYGKKEGKVLLYYVYIFNIYIHL